MFIKYIVLTKEVTKVLWLKGMTKHVDVRLPFVRDIVDSKEVKIEKIVSKKNLTNVFTKSLPRSKFK